MDRDVTALPARRLLLWPGFPDVGETATVTRAKLLVVVSRLSQAEAAVGAAQHKVRVVVILTVILPEANGAYVISAAC